MNSEAHVLQLDQPVRAPEVEGQSVSEQKTAATNESTVGKAKFDSLRIENRFARLKTHLRKRSASIL